MSVKHLKSLANFPRNPRESSLQLMGKPYWYLISLAMYLGKPYHFAFRICNSYNFSYTFEPIVLTEKQKKDALSSHENPSGGELVLGHASLLTDFALSIDEKYIITADRDEHIRVSWYPQGYNIEMYCLGHEKYVVQQESTMVCVI